MRYYIALPIPLCPCGTPSWVLPRLKGRGGDLLTEAEGAGVGGGAARRGAWGGEKGKIT